MRAADMGGAALGTSGYLDALLRPRSVAVLGASEDPAKVGGRIVANLRSSFKGEIIPINPGRSTVQLLPAFASIGAVKRRIDLAIICVKAEDVGGALEQCAAAGVGAAIIFSSGFADSPSRGHERELILDLRRRSGMRTLGPNCLGLISLPDGIVASFADYANVPERQGRVAIVGQSGAMAAQIYRQAQEEGLGVSYLITTGNQVDLSAEEIAEDLLGFSDTSVILLFLEGIANPDLLLRAGRRAAELDKTLVVMKIGNTERASKAAQSHTGSIAVPGAVVDAAFEKVGIVRARSIRELLDFGKAIAHGRRPKGERVAIMTGSGGLGVLMADLAAQYRLDVVQLSAETQAKLAKLVPGDYASLINPVDYTGQIIADPRNLPLILDVLLECEEVDAVCVAGIGRPLWSTMRPALAERIKTATKPFIVYAQDRVHDLTIDGVPVVAEPENAMAVLRARLAPPRRKAAEPKHAAAAGGALSEAESRALLEARGIEFVPSASARGRDEVLQEAERVGYPVVLKINSGSMPHKTEFGAVKLMLGDRSAAGKAHDELAMLAGRIPEVAADYTITVQPQIRADFELLLGATRDPSFGPVISVGIGGRLVEVVKQSVSVVAPVSAEEARGAIERLCDGRLVSSARGLRPEAAATVADFIVRLSALMLETPSIEEVDINPLMVAGDRIYAVDALVVRK